MTLLLIQTALLILSHLHDYYCMLTSENIQSPTDVFQIAYEFIRLSTFHFDVLFINYLIAELLELIHVELVN